jgi:hypothetical protein
MNLDARLRRLAEWSRETVGLEAYGLHEAHLYMERRLEGLCPVFSMEWVPVGVQAGREEGVLPEGTAVVEVELQSGRLIRLMFVGGRTFADKLRFNKEDVQGIIGWLDQTTGLDVERQVRLVEREKGRLVFQTHCDGIPLVPTGRIEVELDGQGRLALFSVVGEFPDVSRIETETFDLDFDREMEETAFDQLKLMTIPVMERKQWVRVYALEEVFVSTDRRTLLPCSTDERAAVPVERIMEWQEFPQDPQRNASRKPFERRPLFPRKTDLTVDEALALAADPAAYSLSEQEITAVVENVRTFLRTEFPAESGKWTLTHITRDETNVVAKLEPVRKEDRFPERKMKVILDAERFEVINYLDGESMFSELFASFAGPEPAAVSKEEAFERLKGRITLSPAYVYDFARQRYILCGKLDCEYGVLASGGDVVALRELVP